ncbi:hypothetical protein BS78_04G048100 [Paspalum vaginatum]|nr:hypothetical protein BS78_04G048100 [Paspalum vaginatum]
MRKVHMFERFAQIKIVCAWLPVCHTCSPNPWRFACCGWRARGQACIPFCSIFCHFDLYYIFCSLFFHVWGVPYDNVLAGADGRASADVRFHHVYVLLQVFLR